MENSMHAAIYENELWDAIWTLTEALLHAVEARQMVLRDLVSKMAASIEPHAYATFSMCIEMCTEMWINRIPKWRLLHGTTLDSVANS